MPTPSTQPLVRPIIPDIRPTVGNYVWKPPQGVSTVGTPIRFLADQATTLAPERCGQPLGFGATNGLPLPTSPGNYQWNAAMNAAGITYDGLCNCFTYNDGVNSIDALFADWLDRMIPGAIMSTLFYNEMLALTTAEQQYWVPGWEPDGTAGLQAILASCRSFTGWVTLDEETQTPLCNAYLFGDLGMPYLIRAQEVLEAQFGRSVDIPELNVLWQTMYQNYMTPFMKRLRWTIPLARVLPYAMPFSGFDRTWQPTAAGGDGGDSLPAAHDAIGWYWNLFDGLNMNTYLAYHLTHTNPPPAGMVWYNDYITARGPYADECARVSALFRKPVYAEGSCIIQGGDDESEAMTSVDSEGQMEIVERAGSEGFYLWAAAAGITSAVTAGMAACKNDFNTFARTAAS